MKQTKYFYDENKTRYHLVKSNNGVNFNWLFVPGGPGSDSSYFLSLVNNLNIPGNIWLIDFPANGDNISTSVKADYNFDRWEDCLITTVRKFENSIYVGHSFGGMFPLLFPQLENLLQGLVILNATPCLWLEEATKLAKENNLPDLSEPMQKFSDNPNTDTFKEALLACAPYYFLAKNLETGKSLLREFNINYHAAVWWLRKAYEINYDAKWIPQNIPTLILGASHDFITPFSLFERDKRFNRDNIKLVKIHDAGHMPWIEQMDSVKIAFSNFVNKLCNNHSFQNKAYEVA